jgi:hypothetical protein
MPKTENGQATFLVHSPAATQDIWEFSGCTCNKLEIAEESGRAGGNAKIALQA